MPTPAEQKALAFVALVTLLAGAVRVMRAGAVANLASPGEQQALARQAYATDSASTRERERKGSRSRKSVQRAPQWRNAGAEFDSTGVLIARSGLDSRGFPPPGPRIDVGAQRPTSLIGLPDAVPRERERTGTPGEIVDLDVADAREIERLPRVGPALARRIVANRDSLGAFGVLSALGRVKGLGPATLARLAPFVTFSGQARR